MILHSDLPVTFTELSATNQLLFCLAFYKKCFKMLKSEAFSFSIKKTLFYREDLVLV